MYHSLPPWVPVACCGCSPWQAYLERREQPEGKQDWRPVPCSLFHLTSWDVWTEQRDSSGHVAFPFCSFLSLLLVSFLKRLLFNGKATLRQGSSNRRHRNGSWEGPANSDLAVGTPRTGQKPQAQRAVTPHTSTGDHQASSLLGVRLLRLLGLTSVSAPIAPGARPAGPLTSSGQLPDVEKTTIYMR